MNWTQDLIKPLENNNVGEDPRYDLNFLKIKREIEKLSGTDYAWIFQQVQILLSQQFKDLRLGNYLILAATYLDGIEGLIEGLSVYQQLIENYSADIHPQRPEIRLNTIQWLDQEKIVWFLAAKPCHDESLWHKVIDRIEGLSFQIKQKYTFEIAVLPGLKNFVQQKIKKSQYSPMPAILPRPYENNSQATTQSPQKIISIVEQYIGNLWEQEEWLSAAAYARALRWSSLKTPPDVADITKIPPPRTAAVNQLQATIQNEDSLKIYLCCESLLLEPSGHVWLDLQFYAVSAAKMMNNDDLVGFLEMEVLSLYKRLPRLIELQFADQKSFANLETKNWLESLLVPSENKSENIEHPELTTNQILTEIKAQKLIKFEEKVAVIHAIESKNKKSDFLKNWALAKLLAKEKYYELANIKFLQLNGIVKQHQLMVWEPVQTLEIWSDWYRVLNHYLKKVDESEKISIKNTLQQLKRDILNLNTHQAIFLFTEK